MLCAGLLPCLRAGGVRAGGCGQRHRVSSSRWERAARDHRRTGREHVVYRSVGKSDRADQAFRTDRRLVHRVGDQQRQRAVGDRCRPRREPVVHRAGEKSGWADEPDELDGLRIRRRRRDQRKQWPTRDRRRSGPSDLVCRGCRPDWAHLVCAGRRACDHGVTMELRRAAVRWESPPAPTATSGSPSKPTGSGASRRQERSQSSGAESVRTAVRRRSRLAPMGTSGSPRSFGNRIARITTSGTVTEFPVTAGSQPRGIVAGPDGNLWFAEPFGDRIGRITPAGKVTEYSTGITRGSEPTYLAVGPTEPCGSRRATTCATRSGVSSSIPQRPLAAQPRSRLAAPSSRGP